MKLGLEIGLESGGSLGNKVFLKALHFPSKALLPLSRSDLTVTNREAPASGLAAEVPAGHAAHSRDSDQDHARDREWSRT